MTPTRALTLIATLATISCQGFLPGCDPDPDPTTGDTEEPALCDVTIEETWPESSSAYFYCRADVEFQLSDPDPEGEPVLSLTSGGLDVPGESWLSEDGETVHFTPAAPLDPYTDHTATLSYCRGEASVEFTTSELCTPLEEDLEGRTYLVPIMRGRMVEPEGYGDVIVDFVGEPNFLVEVQRADDLLVFLGAATEGHGPEQNLCAPTIAFPPADFTEAPYFEVPPSLVDIQVEDNTVSLHEFTMSGMFVHDGSWFGGGVIGGELDARDLAELVPEIESPEELCELVASFGAACEACTSDGELFCLPVLIDRIEGFEVPVDVAEVTDPSANPDC